MWPHKNLDWWAFVLALTALILAYPLEVLAHLTAPMLRDWWAARSRKSIQIRIEQLKAVLSEIERFQLMSLTEDFTFMGIQHVASLIQYSIQVVVGIGIVGLALLGISLTKLLYMEAFAWFLMGMNFVTYRVMMSSIRDYRREHGPMRRVKLQMEITKLTDKLSK